MSRHTTVLVLCLVMALGAKASLTASGAGAATSTLKKVGSRVDGRAGIIAIEASDPVSYVAAQPDPRTFVIELRNVATQGFADNFTPDARHPFSAVRVESGQTADGVLVARVRMTLTAPLRPRVRSSRNVIYVEADRLDRVPREGERISTAIAPPASPPSAEPAPLVRAPALQAAPVAAQAAAPAPAQTPIPAGQTRFTGFPVSLDFQDADLRAVLRTFSEISGLNVVIDPSIQGRVDVALRDVPWDQALDIILRANQLGYTVEGTIVRITPLRVLAAEQAERQKLSEAQALAGELQTITRTLSYALASDVAGLLTSTRVVSERGNATPEPRTNTVILNDLPENLQRALALITTLDRPEPQVEIEARIVRTTREFSRQIGVQWGFRGRAASALGNPLPLAFPNQVDATGAVNLAAVPTAPSTIGLALGAVNGALNLDLALSAAEDEGRLRVLSTPRVATQNNVAAEIVQGAQIPIQTVANNTVTVTFREAALSLRVTPHITSSQTVIMDIIVENASLNRSVPTINGIPQIDTQRATTKVLVSDGETTVIGGIYESAESLVQFRTPALYRIPLLGWLFRRDIVRDETEELLIFITPRIIRLQEAPL